MNKEEVVSKKISDAITDESKLLNLSGMDLKHIPPEITKIKSLQILNLKDNKIKVLKPLFGLPNLKVIYLNNNQITDIHTEFFNSVDLHVLDLINNQLSNIPETLENQINLRRLFISYNNLTKLSAAVCKLDRLELLDISGNQLNKIPKHINRLKQLSYLTANNNQLVDAEIDFKRLSKLESVNLSSNQLTKIPDSLFQAKSLKWLLLYSNKIATFPALENADLPNCKINLADNELTNINLINAKLEDIHLYFNPLAGNQTADIRNLKTEEIFIDFGQAKNFTVDPKRPTSVKIINNEKMEIQDYIYKTIPDSIMKKFKLKSRYQVKLEKLKNNSDR